MASDKVIGIDLGTTNSCVAIVENGTPSVIPNRGGYKTTPSMVAVTEAGKRLVGHIAKRQAITNAENTVYAAKRLIGRKWNSPQVKNAVATSSYRIVEGPHHDVRVVLRDKEFSVPEISAMVLQEMKVIAEDYLGEPVSKAVVTVPAYFNDNQRQATKDAVEKAKCELSSVPETEVNLPFIISSGRNEALHLQRALNRQILEELSDDLIERTVDICRQTLEDARLEKDEIEEVVLVGGMTRMPKIQQAVAQFFEREPSKGVHPDEVVALGAAIQGSALMDEKHEMILLDVTPHALGIMTFGNYFEELIAQNTTASTHRQKIFTTSSSYHT